MAKAKRKPPSRSQSKTDQPTVEKKSTKNQSASILDKPAKDKKPDTKPNLFTRLLIWIKAHKFWSIVFALLIFGAAFLIYILLKPKQYKTTTVQRRDLTKVIEVSGEIDAEEQVDLHFQALGKLAWIGVEEGDQVQKWHAVAKQDAKSLEKELKKDLNEFNREFRDHDQTLDDYDFYGTPDLNREVRRILEKAQFDLDDAVLDVEIQDLTNKLATLITPISGIVTQVDTPVAGVNVTATDSIEIVNPDTLYFSAQIDEIDVALIKEGQKAEIVLDAYATERLSSSITHIDFHASTSDGGGTIFLTKLNLPENNALKYRLGMNGEAFINVASSSAALSIPFEATKTVNGKTQVQVLIDNKPQEREIQIGIETDEYMEIISGLNEGDVIIIGE